MSTTLVTRQTAGTGATVKGSPLTNAEVDANFINLNNATQPAGGTAGQVLAKTDATDFNSQWIDNYSTAIQVPVKAGVALTKGQAVYITGATGANIIVGLAKADAEVTSSKTFGLINATLAINGAGNVVCEGPISGIDTSSATEGDPVWLSPTTAGGLLFGVANKPSAPNHMVYLGVVSRSHATQGQIQVKVQNGFELEELHNVSAQSPTTGQSLVYNSSTGLWAKSFAPVLNGTTVDNTTIGATTPASGAFTSLTASSDPSFTSTGAVQLPSGTTAQQPTGVAGKLRFNTTTNKFEGFDGAAWASVGGSALINNDTTTSTNVYPLFSAATSGTITTVYTSNAKYLYKPSTGELQAPVVNATNGALVIGNTVSANCTIPSGSNAISIGPWTVNAGVTFTVPAGSRHILL